MMHMTPATEKQINYLLTLCNRLTGDTARFLSQHRQTLGLASSKCSRGLSKSEASAIIESLLAKVGK